VGDAAKGGFVNLHLFVSPEDYRHVDELRSLLPLLQQGLPRLPSGRVPSLQRSGQPESPMAELA
jgi:hypothetical protein